MDSTPEGQTAGPDGVDGDFDLDEGSGGIDGGLEGKYGGGFTIGAINATDWNLLYPVNRRPESGGKNLG